MRGKNITFHEYFRNRQPFTLSLIFLPVNSASQHHDVGSIPAAEGGRCVPQQPPLRNIH